MKTGALGLSLIKAAEVFISYVYSDQDKQWPRRRLHYLGGLWYYPDDTRAPGTATYGYGFIAHTPADCPGDITEEQASEKLAMRLGDYEAAINRGWAKSFAGHPDPTQNQFDALASFAWNEGGGAVQKLIDHLSQIALDDAAAVQALFLAWDKWTVQGELVENAGLKLRRMKEATLFLRPVEIAWGPADVGNILASIHETAIADVEPFLDGSPLPDDPPPNAA
jgi:GH24 family phage-related lysozyme (muramidase)